MAQSVLHRLLFFFFNCGVKKHLPIHLLNSNVISLPPWILSSFVLFWARPVTGTIKLGVCGCQWLVGPALPPGSCSVFFASGYSELVNPEWVTLFSYFRGCACFIAWEVATGLTVSFQSLLFPVASTYLDRRLGTFTASWYGGRI